MKLTIKQISLSTADEERSYFSGSKQGEVQNQSGNVMPTGTYRVVDGSLYLVLPTQRSAANPLADLQLFTDFTATSTYS